MNSSKVEAPKSKIRFISLYTLSELEKKSLKDRLTITKGTCQAWIHTHHAEGEEILLERRKPQISNYRQKSVNWKINLCMKIV